MFLCRVERKRSMTRALFLSLFSLAVLGSFGCGSAQKQAERIDSLETDLKQLKWDVAALKQKDKPEHNYELRKDGFRTWRFDPSTGETCIQLTSEADWKRKETQSQSCDCRDATRHYMEMPMGSEREEKAADNYFKMWVQQFCGS